MTDLIEDTQHWQNLQPPLAPNAVEVAIYSRHIEGRRPVCLLGLTKSLLPLSDVTVDLADGATIKSNWNDLTGSYGAVIGDGVLNLEGLQLINRVAKVTSRFVARVFTKKLPGMKYATIFPTEFPGSSFVIQTQENVVIVVYDLDTTHLG